MKEKTERNDAIFAQWVEGASYSDIAQEFGISKGRAHEIVTSHPGYPYYRTVPLIRLPRGLFQGLLAMEEEDMCPLERVVVRAIGR